MNTKESCVGKEDLVESSSNNVFDEINVVHFADDFPSPEKWDACVEYIASLKVDELMRQAGNVLEALSYCGMGDYNVRIRLNDILSECFSRIGAENVMRHFNGMLDKQQREIDLYEKHDYDGLLREGFIGQEEYERLGAAHISEEK